MKEVEITFKASAKEPSREDFLAACSRAVGLPIAKIADYRIDKRSLDARGKDILYRYKITVSSIDEGMIPPYIIEPYKNVADCEQVIIVGAGPAGLFAALKLLQRGLKPIILERGKDVHERKVDNATLCKDGTINPDSNYCFGEGGAGTFSDGKLYTRSNKKGNIKEVLHQFVEFGADPNILIEAHAHIGSDKLPKVIENLRNNIISHGGEVHFNTRVVDFKKDGELWVAECNDGKTYSASNIILATGHSARDIYELFDSKGWYIEAKGFALGVRAEHPQYLINNIQYKNRYQQYLPTAEYSLVCQIDGRGVFSFCMCPGGLLVPSSTAPGQMLLNGMSNSMRNSKWANAGIVVPIEVSDVPEFAQYGALQLMRFQESVEKAMFNHGGGSIKAPAQRMTDFVKGKLSDTLPSTSYIPGAYSAPLHDILPEFVVQRLKKAFLEFNKKMKGYYTPDALLLGVESRTSSPVRIPRDPSTMQHVELSGIYPCGEGAGYAGGIVSSALDGINAANTLANNILK